MPKWNLQNIGKRNFVDSDDYSEGVGISRRCSGGAARSMVWRHGQGHHGGAAQEHGVAAWPGDAAGA